MLLTIIVYFKCNLDCERVHQKIKSQLLPGRYICYHHYGTVKKGKSFPILVTERWARS